MRFTMTGLTFGNGLVGSRTHDSDFRLTGLSDGSVIDRSYGFDTSGNITAITDNLNALDSQTLDYDNLDRLTDATGNYGDIDFAYDATGNRGSLTLNSSAVDNYGYSTNTHHLSSVTGANPQSFSFGAAGNIVGRNGATHVIDDRGRLASITAGASTTVYAYNARGERVRKSSAGNTTDYVYRGHLLLLESEGAQSREYAYLNGQPLAAWDITGSGETQYYFHNDHLGTPQVMTDSAQTVVWQAAYGPFGEATITTATVENNLRFPGQYFDGESGLHYNYYRYYDPET